MSDPERMLASTFVGDSLERELLGSIRNVTPPPGAKSKTWDGIAIQAAAVAALGAGGVFVHTAAASATTGAVAQAAAGGTVSGTTAIGAGVPATVAAAGIAAKAISAKAVIGVVVAALTVGGGGLLASRKMAEKAVVAPVVQQAKSEMPRSAPTAWDTAATIAPCDPAFPTSPCPQVAVPGPEAPVRAPDGPRQRNLLPLESRMLTEARAQLRSGDPRAALATLERLQDRSPRGVLVQERDVLTIQILAALGDSAAAGRKAKAFLDAYPNSPHAPQVRRFAGEP
jgi:hypothetical protein